MTRLMSCVIRKPVYAIDSIIPLVSISEISSLCLASVAEQAGLSLTWSQTPKTGFLATRLIFHVIGMYMYHKEIATLVNCNDPKYLDRLALASSVDPDIFAIFPSVENVLEAMIIYQIKTVFTTGIVKNLLQVNLVLCVV